MEYLKDILGVLVITLFATALLFIPDCAEAAQKDKPSSMDKEELQFIDPYEMEWGTRQKDLEPSKWVSTLPETQEVPDPPEIDFRDPFGVRRGLR